MPNEQDWKWDMAKQAWHHLLCGAHADKERQECPKCRERTPDCFRWSDVLQWANDNGWDNDEYVSWNRHDCPGDQDAQVWGGHWRIAVWWCPGDNEGWYAHIDRIEPHQDHWIARNRILAKFWDPQRAADFTTAVTQYIYDHRS